MKIKILSMFLGICPLLQAHIITNNYEHTVKAFGQEGTWMMTNRVTYILPGQTKTLEMNADRGTHKVKFIDYGKDRHRQLLGEFYFESLDRFQVYYFTVNPDGTVTTKPLQCAPTEEVKKNTTEQALKIQATKSRRSWTELGDHEGRRSS